MAATKPKTLTKSKSRSPAQGQNSAVINPYALAELIAVGGSRGRNSPMRRACSSNS